MMSLKEHRFGGSGSPKGHNRSAECVVVQALQPKYNQSRSTTFQGTAGSCLCEFLKEAMTTERAKMDEKRSAKSRKNQRKIIIILSAL